jgi:hypothetical protein
VPGKALGLQEPAEKRHCLCGCSNSGALLGLTRMLPCKRLCRHKRKKVCHQVFTKGTRVHTDMLYYGEVGERLTELPVIPDTVRVQNVYCLMTFEFLF